MAHVCVYNKLLCWPKSDQRKKKLNNKKLQLHSLSFDTGANLKKKKRQTHVVPYYTTCLTTSLTNDMGLSLSLTQHNQSRKEEWRDERSCESGANPKKKVPEEKLTPITKKSKLMTVLQDLYFLKF